MLLGCGGLRLRTVSPVWQMPYMCWRCQKRWGFICAWAAAGLQEQEPGKIHNCEVRHVSLHPAPSLGTNTVQISNVRGRDTSQIVLRFQELIMFSRKQSCSPSSAVGRATAASNLLLAALRPPQQPKPANKTQAILAKALARHPGAPTSRVVHAIPVPEDPKQRAASCRCCHGTSEDVSLAGQARLLAVTVLARLGSERGADSPRMAWDPVLGGRTQRRPRSRDNFRDDFWRGAKSSRLGWRQAVSPGGWEDTKGDEAGSNRVTLPWLPVPGPPCVPVP